MRSILIDPDLKSVTEVDCVDFRDVLRRIRGYTNSVGDVVRMGIQPDDELMFLNRCSGKMFSLEGLNIFGPAIIISTDENGQWKSTDRMLVDIQTRVKFLGSLNP